jgi:hypothetical protein
MAVLVGEVQGRVRGYLVPANVGDGAAESEADALARIGQERRCALITMGPHEEPAPAWMPSITC